MLSQGRPSVTVRVISPYRDGGSMYSDGLCGNPPGGGTFAGGSAAAGSWVSGAGAVGAGVAAGAPPVEAEAGVAVAGRGACFGGLGIGSDE